MKGLPLNKMATLLVLAVLLPALGWAYGGGRNLQGPPAEAYAACEGKSAGDQVEFTNRRGETVEATCRQMDGRMVALCDDGPRARRDGMGRGGARMAAVLDLTAEQQEQIEAIFAQEQEKVAPLREKMRENRDQMRTAVHAGSAQESQIRALAAEQAEIRADLMVARARAWDRINALLTPEQQKKAAELGPGRRGDKEWCRHR